MSFWKEDSPFIRAIHSFGERLYLSKNPFTLREG